MTSQSTPKSLGTVLVIGGCGFLGFHIVDQLLNFPSETSSSDPDPTAQQPSNNSNGHTTAFPPLRTRYPPYTATTVAVLDLTVTKNHVPGVTYHSGDITSVPDVLSVFREVKPDVVIHTASPPVEVHKSLLEKVNVEGTRTLLEVAAGLKGDWGGKCRAFVYTSSSSVVHDNENDMINVDERWPYMRGPMQKSYYSETKANAEELVLSLNRKHNNMLTTAVRPAGIIGERDSAYTLRVLKHALLSHPYVLRFQLGDNNNLFDFTYAGNIAYAHLLAAERLLATANRIQSGELDPLEHERVDGEAFICTNDSPVYFWDMTRAAWAHAGKIVEPHQVWELGAGFTLAIASVVEALFGLFGKKPNLTRMAAKQSTLTRYLSCEKAKDRLGYKPLVAIDEGIARAVRNLMETEQVGKVKKEL